MGNNYTESSNSTVKFLSITLFPVNKFAKTPNNFKIHGTQLFRISKHQNQAYGCKAQLFRKCGNANKTRT